MGGLTDEVSFGNFYIPQANKCYITNFEHGSVDEISVPAAGITQAAFQTSLDELFPDAGDRNNFCSVFHSLQGDTLKLIDDALNSSGLQATAGAGPGGVNNYDTNDEFGAGNTPGANFDARTATLNNAAASGAVNSRSLDLKVFWSTFFKNQGNNSTALGKTYDLISEFVFRDNDPKAVEKFKAVKSAMANATDWASASDKVAEILAEVSARTSDGQTTLLVRPRVVAVMSSAILAAPGEDTGSLLVGYPFVSIFCFVFHTHAKAMP